MTMRALNVMALTQGRFIGLNDPQVSNKEWAIRIMAKIIDKGQHDEVCN